MSVVLWLSSLPRLVSVLLIRFISIIQLKFISIIQLTFISIIPTFYRHMLLCNGISEWLLGHCSGAFLASIYRKISQSCFEQVNPDLPD